MPLPTPQLLSFLQQLYRLQTFNELAETLCRELPALIPGDNVMVAKQNGVDRSLATAVLLKPFGRMNMMPVFNETGWMAQCPMWCHLTLELGEKIGDFVTVNITRSRLGFIPEEREALFLLRPHLLQAFQNACLAEKLGLSAAEDGASIVLPLTQAGDIAPEAEAQRNVLAAKFQTPQGLPAEVAAWVKNNLCLLNQGVFHQRIAPLRHTQAGRTHVYTLLRDWNAGRYLLVIQTESPAAGTSLSPRERDILLWVAEGKTNEEIGIILGIGAETVKTHLRRCYTKLGVENRTAATCAWLRMQKEWKGR